MFDGAEVTGVRAVAERYPSLHIDFPAGRCALLEDPNSHGAVNYGVVIALSAAEPPAYKTGDAPISIGWRAFL